MKLEFDIEKLVAAADHNQALIGTPLPHEEALVEGAECNGTPIHARPYWPVVDRDVATGKVIRTWLEVYLGDEHNVYITIDVERARKAAHNDD